MRAIHLPVSSIIDEVKACRTMRISTRWPWSLSFSQPVFVEGPLGLHDMIVDVIDRRIDGDGRQSREPDRVERTIEIPDNCPHLLKFEIEDQACHRRTP